MLIRRHDSPIDPEREWRDLFLAHPFGTLIAPGIDRDLPVVVPTHVHFDGEHAILLHLAKANPVWKALRENPRCMFSVVSAVTYVPNLVGGSAGHRSEMGHPDLALRIGAARLHSLANGGPR